MRESIDKKSKCQNIAFSSSHRSKTISILNPNSLLSEKIEDFCKVSFLRNCKIADKLSVRKLRVFYLALIGENTK